MSLIQNCFVLAIGVVVRQRSVNQVPHQFAKPAFFCVFIFSSACNYFLLCDVIPFAVFVLFQI